VAGKQYEAIRVWRRTDPRTGADTNYVPGDPYTAPVEPNMVSPEGPDGKGPVIAEKSTPAISGDSSSKEK
jgi:hypothetical protein